MSIHGPRLLTPEPPAFSAACTGTIIVIEIGPNHARYNVHEAMLMFHSEYFHKALHGQWKEAEDKVVRLTDIGRSEFNLFVHWLYTGKIPSTAKSWSQVLDGQESRDERPAFVLVKAYALGDRLRAPGFYLAAYDHLVDFDFDMRHLPEEILPVVRWAFENIPADRIILQFLTNFFCEMWVSTHDDTKEVLALASFPPKFVARLLRRFSLTKRDGIWDYFKDCYMEHTSKNEAANCTLEFHAVYDEAMDYSFAVPTAKLKAELEALEA